MTTYYVGPTGNDTTGSGSLVSPWLTLTKFRQVAANNDTCLMLDGTYVLGANPFLTSVTTMPSGITVMPAAGANININRTGDGYIIDARNVTGWQFLLNGGAVNMARTDALPPNGINDESISSLRLFNSHSCYVDGWKTNRMAGNGFCAETSDDIVFQRVYASHTSTGARFRMTAQNCQLLDSYIFDNDVMCRNNNNNADFGGGGVSLAHNSIAILVARNHIYNNVADSNYYEKDGAGVETFAMAADSGCRVTDNDIWDCQGFFETGCDLQGHPTWTNGGLELDHNRIFGKANFAVADKGSWFLLRGAPGWHIHHNTIDAENGPNNGIFRYEAGGTYGGTTENIVIHDNILFIRMNSQADQWNEAVQPGWQSYNNLVYYNFNFAGNVYHDPTPTGFTKTQLAAAKTYTGQLQGSIWSTAVGVNDPLFQDNVNANKALRDYHLKGNSPALNAGSDGNAMGPYGVVTAGPAFQADAFQQDVDAGVEFVHPALAGVGRLGPRAVGAETFQHPTFLGTAKQTIKSTGAVAFAHPSVAGVAKEANRGTGAEAFARPGLSAAGKQKQGGFGQATFARPSLAGTGVVTGFVLISGPGGVAFQKPALAAVGKESVRGSATETFARPSLAAVAKEKVSGSAAELFARPAMFSAGSSQLRIHGDGALAFQRPSPAGFAAGKHAGPAALAFARPALAGTGEVVQKIAGFGAVAFGLRRLCGYGQGQKGAGIREYTVQLMPRVNADDQLWRSPLWERTTAPGSAEQGAGRLNLIYDGPEVPPGLYSLRYRVLDMYGEYSTWSYDHTLEVTEGVESHLDIDYSAHVGIPVARVRIVLRDLEDPVHGEGDVQSVDPSTGQYSRGPGVIKAVIEDALNIGMSAFVTNPGEVHFTLPALHPQLSECLPYRRHFEVHQFREGAWVVVSEGLLHDVDVSTDDVVVYGWDYLGLLALSVETAIPAGVSDDDKEPPIEPELGPDGDPIDPKQETGSKYINKNISDIIESQLKRTMAEEDGPLGWVKMGVVDSMPEPTTIYASYVQRLQFISSLIDSYASGTGVRPRLSIEHDRPDNGYMKFQVREDSGVDRPNLRLEYGSLMQGFEVVAYGDFATSVHGIGHRPLDVKPLFAARTASGMDTQVWGNITKAELWANVTDQSDLTRRVLQRAAEHARIGKQVAIAIRVHGLEPFQGFDLLDAIPLAIDRGPIETRWWSPDSDDFTWWVIWGMQWSINATGVDELVLIVKPRIDNTNPLPDTATHPLLKPIAVAHLADDWRAIPLPDPGDTLLRGVDDLSTVNVTQLRASGGDFLVRHLTRGTYFTVDSVNNVNNAISRGLVGGFIHFLTHIENINGDAVPWNTGTKQCDYFVDRLPNNSPEGYLIQLDIETNPNGNDVHHQDKVYPGNLPLTRAEVRTFLDRWVQLFPKHPILIYSNQGQWHTATKYAGTNLDAKSIAPNAYAWQAGPWFRHDEGRTEFLNDQDAPANFVDVMEHLGWGGFNKAKILQFGQTHLADGHATDGDICYPTMTLSDLTALTVSSTPPPVNRAAYVLGYNTKLANVITAVPGVSGGSGGTDYTQGVTDAGGDIVADLMLLELETT